MNATETAKAIRNALKSEGIPARAASVRVRPGGSVDVLVRDGSISLTRVKSIAGKLERVHRDEGTGEILCGGNLLVFCEYAPEALAALRAEVQVQLEANAHTIEGFNVYPHKHGGYVFFRNGTHAGEGFFLESAARVLAELIAEQRAAA